jgi:hypothetical protein
MTTLEPRLYPMRDHESRYPYWRCANRDSDAYTLVRRTSRDTELPWLKANFEIVEARPGTLPATRLYHLV